MVNYSLFEINEDIKRNLPPDRYIHSLGVAYTAASLAMKYNCSIDKAMIAGMLHDYSKKDSDKTYIKFCQDNNLIITQVEYQNPGLLHAKISSFYAKNKFNIKDYEILSAIDYHTTGKPEMTILEKIVYISDYIEPSRTKQPNLTEIRREAFEDIDKALLHILSDTIDHLKSSGKVIDSQTKQTYLYYKGI